MILERTINGEPYVFTANTWGWAVGCRGAMTDRFHRNYQVITTPGGRPLKCSCPHSVKAGAWCKHLREAELLHREGINPREKHGQASETSL